MAHKVFITGGSGFVGRALSASLLQAGHKVWSPDFDLTLPSSQWEISALGSWDVVIHLAGISDAATCKADPAKAKAVNVDMTGRLAETLAQQKTKPLFIFAGSGMVYRPSAKPLMEDDVIEPQNAYAETKYAAEVLLKELAQKHDMPTTVLRLFNHTHHSQDPRFFLPFIYQQLLSIKAQKMPAKVAVGNIKVQRDLGTIQDLLQVFHKLLAKPALDFEVMNVCSGQARELDALALELARQMEVPCEFVVDPEKVRADHDFIVGSCDRLQKRLNWQPEVLTDVQFIERFLENINL